MKLLISSDYHINEKNRLEDFTKNLRIIEETSQNDSYDYFIIAGDIFDKKHPTIKELVVFSEHLQNIQAEKIILIRGNHVKISKEYSALDLFKYDKRVSICDFSEIGTDNIRRNIFITHETILETLVGVNNINIPGKSLEEFKDYDLVISGHIHKPQFIKNKNTQVIVPGSIERVNFGERDEKKFYWIVNITKTGKINITKKELPTRKMLKVVYNIDDGTRTVNDKQQDPKSSLEATTGAIVQLILRGKKSTIKKVNYDKLIKPFKDVYSLDLRLEYSQSHNNVNNNTSCMVINNDNIVNQLKTYCKNNELDKDVFKISEKIING